MKELLPGPIPPETEATCEDCAMWPGPGDRPSRDFFFRLDTKCCTYIPTLPNFLIGRILDDPDPAFAVGRKTIEDRIAARLGVTPVGLASPPVFSLLYQQGAGQAFGRSRRLRCPHYQEETGGRCGIWRHRNATCATWFCKHVRGAVGLRFWRALDQLLTITERALARWCLLKLYVAPAALHRLFPPGTDRVTTGSLDGDQIDGVVEDTEYRGCWANWADGEMEFYRKAAGLVRDLRWSEVATIAGPDVCLYASLVVDRYRELVSEGIPERLSVGPYQTVMTGRRRSRVVGYSNLDALDLPAELIAVLPYFDGGSTADSLDRIRRQKRLTLEPALLQRLIDFGVLTQPEADLGTAAAKGERRPRRRPT